jgi:PadR family transcriptional regulator PadR
MGETRLTHQGLLVLKAFMDNPSFALAGVDLLGQTGLASGTLYPILLRFERSGLLQSEWEDGEAADLGRPRRRLYTITRLGASTLRQAVAQLTSPATLNPAGARL